MVNPVVVLAHLAHVELLRVQLGLHHVRLKGELI